MNTEQDIKIRAAELSVKLTAMADGRSRWRRWKCNVLHRRSRNVLRDDSGAAKYVVCSKCGRTWRVEL